MSDGEWPYEPTKDEIIVIKAVLCAGRHEPPADSDGFVFHKDEYRHPLDFNRLTMEARKFFTYIVGEMIDEEDGPSGIEFGLYVTGPPSMLVAFLQEYMIYERELDNLWGASGMTLRLYHYDTETGDYKPQYWELI